MAGAGAGAGVSVGVDCHQPSWSWSPYEVRCLADGHRESSTLALALATPSVLGPVKGPRGSYPGPSLDHPKLRPVGTGVIGQWG